MPKELTRIPLNSAGVHPILKDRWELLIEPPKRKPDKDDDDKKKSRKPEPEPQLPWGIQVLAFAKEDARAQQPSSSVAPEKPADEPEKGEPGKDEPGKDEPGKDEPGKDEPAKQDPPGEEPAKQEPAKQEEAQPRPRFPVFKSFEDFLDKTAKKATFEIRAKESKQRSGLRHEYRWYEWTQGPNRFLAAAYDREDLEVVLLGTRRVAPKVDEKEERAWKKLEASIDRQLEDALESLTFETNRNYEERMVLGEARWANTDLRREILEQEKKTIAGYREWSLFCTEHFIVKYSHDLEKGAREEMWRFAADIARRMGEMIKVYEEYFPPHDKVLQWWSVLRICRTHDEFSKYGSTHPGVIGWFNPLSKELVIFRSKAWSEAVAYHEGWHQYAHFWFGGKPKLHRWFDEGHGDFFGSMDRKSMNRWELASSKMRLATIKKLVNEEKTVPLKDIVRWHKDKFYNPRTAGLYYAQGWAMVDFLRRGKGGDLWDESFAKIIPTYVQTCLDTGDSDKAADAAFEGIDWDLFEQRFKAWVTALD